MMQRYGVIPTGEIPNYAYNYKTSTYNLVKNNRKES